MIALAITPQQLGESLVGLNKTAALFACECANVECRLVCEDGMYYVVTRDFRVNRLNLSVENGLVIKVTCG